MDPPAANGAAFMPESSRVQFIVDWRPFGMAFTAAEERREGRRRLSLAFWRGRKHKVNRVVNVSLSHFALRLEMVADRYLYGETARLTSSSANQKMLSSSGDEHG